MIIPEAIKISAPGAAAKEIVGELALGSLPRLQSAVLEDDAAIHCGIKIHCCQESRRQLINCQLEYNAKLICQRCMQPYTETIKTNTEFVAIKYEDQAQNLDENQEPVQLSDGKVNLFKMIEDELLLSLPIIPMHQETECSIKLERIRPKPSQFDILATLKKSGENHGCTKES